METIASTACVDAAKTVSLTSALIASASMVAVGVEDAPEVDEDADVSLSE